MAVMLFKLNTGEEIIATLDNDRFPEYTTVKNVLMIVMVTPQSYTLLPYMLYAKGGIIHLRKDNIVAEAQAQDRLIEKYNENFSTIEVPDKSLVLPA